MRNKGHGYNNKYRVPPFLPRTKPWEPAWRRVPPTYFGKISAETPYGMRSFKCCITNIRKSPTSAHDILVCLRWCNLVGLRGQPRGTHLNGALLEWLDLYGFMVIMLLHDCVKLYWVLMLARSLDDSFRGRISPSCKIKLTERRSMCSSQLSKVKLQKTGRISCNLSKPDQDFGWDTLWTLDSSS
jgi:hypothetical protein